ncbi:TrkA C-terminal domain-containing protein [Halomicrobium urmianum]|uniref:TrkA C-terminal domain-containing protein n=1 Tax=Halomicrobium urmianum TaxID=1586233 RepID=UPI001CDA50CA|nr:TrkA C-terminal domain-containing protein [Halomicrobium urmianum]
MQLLQLTAERVVTAVAQIAGTAALAGLLAGVVALLYRWYVRERVPRGLALLVGLAGVAVVVNTTPLLAQEIGNVDGDVEVLAALTNVTLFVVGGLGATAGTRLGDALATDLFAATGRDVDADVSEIVQSVGRVTTVALPEEIDDVVGYDPVPEATTETLSGRRFLFPRRLTRVELRERLVSRLKSDYGVGHVDVELAEDGSVEYLAVGSRAAGIGPTLPPATNAVAIRADPAHAASAGDLVQVWETDPVRRVLTGELRGVAGDVVTVAIDAADTSKLDPTERYRLVTLPVQDRPDREFASLLRAADETMATVTVESGSRLDGARVGDVEVTVAAITREDVRPEPLPAADRTLEPGDVLYAIATPDLLRRLSEAAEWSGGTDAGASSVGERSAGDEPAVAEVPGDDESPGDPTPVGDAESDDGGGRTRAAAQSEAGPDSDGASAGEAADATRGDDGETSDGGETATEAPSGGSEGEAPTGADGTAADEATDDGGEPAEGTAPDPEPAAETDDAADLTGDAFPDTDDLPGSDLETPTLPGDGGATPENGEDAPAEDGGDETTDGADDPSPSTDADDREPADGDDAPGDGADSEIADGHERDETSVIDQAWDDLEPLVGEGGAGENLNDLDGLLGEDGDDAPADGADSEIADGDENDRDGDERRG